MVIQTNFLRTLNLSNPYLLYRYLITLTINALNQLEEENFATSKYRWGVLFQNFNITEEEIKKFGVKAKETLLASQKKYGEMGVIELPDIWFNTLVSLFFIIEPDIIEKNPESVEKLWIEFYKRSSTHNNYITFLNIQKI